MLLEYEQMMLQNGASFVAGVDEAGRGPLAGPVVVAAVCMPLDNIVEGINDSKKLSAKKRDKLFDVIMQTALEVQVAVVDEQTIDRINILNATKQGMVQVINGLQKADAVLIDAVKLNINKATMSIIHGDALSYNIAAASIVAKVTRDRMMLDYHNQYPQYNFAKHKGYGTAEHIKLLKEHGPCPIHRRSFIGHFVEV
ncbi:MAG: ribonuclease HII [Clostridia bacterium]|nr:ribonuclease HII [Clostridia bacterium]